MTTPIEVNSIAAINASTKATGKGTLDQNDFLRLLTTQLQTQDPFSPMDTNSMVSQMSQLSNNAGLAEMNSSLKQLVSLLGDSRGTDAANWIGLDALVADTSVNRDRTGNFRGEVTLASAANSVTLDLLDSSGQVVHSENRDKVSAGTFGFEWDGATAAGPLNGPLTVRVTARNASGPVSATTNVWTPVSAVQSPAGGAAQRLVTPNGLIAPEAALRLG